MAINGCANSTWSAGNAAGPAIASSRTGASVSMLPRGGRIGSGAGVDGSGGCQQETGPPKRAVSAHAGLGNDCRLHAAVAVSSQQLQPCPHCFRSFRPSALETHAKVCRSVFPMYDTRPGRQSSRSTSPSFLQEAPRVEVRGSGLDFNSGYTVGALGVGRRGRMSAGSPPPPSMGGSAATATSPPSHASPRAPVGVEVFDRFGVESQPPSPPISPPSSMSSPHSTSIPSPLQQLRAQTLQQQQQQQPQQHQQQQMSMHGVGLQQPMSAPHAAFVSPTPYRDPSLASTAHVERSNGYPPVSSAVGMPPAPATGCVVGGDPAGNVTGGYGVAPSAFTSVGVVGADAVRPVEKLSVTPSFAGVGPAALAAAPVQRMPMPPSEPPPAEPSAAVGGAPPLGTPPVVALQQESLGTPSQTISEDSQGLSQSESASRGQGLSASSAGASSAAALGLITAEAKERMLDPKDPKARSRAKASVPKKSLAEVLRAHRKAEETILKAMRSQNSSRLCVAELRAMSEPVYHFYIDFVNFCCPSNLPQSDEQQWEMLCKALKKHFEKEFGANQTQKPAQPQRPNNTLGDFITIQTESKSAKKNKVNRAGGGGGGRGGRAAGANEKKDGLAAGGSDCAGGAEDSTAQSSSWVCPLCTLRNENLQLECGACGTSQHQASLWKEFPPLG
eukprot:TRINITY_DN19226_c0_g3_i2.p1 TRINITY_DN19226_c0_g3~~TRINITY_DN19226_c0_g3_i2.p1  ORF type:complete len:712 (+),score=150.36 TRINITY_DN19226_c0_g3_i2:119-2137(+)